jgi:uncharacterized tellurite resistance protein B-like protein
VFGWFKRKEEKADRKKATVLYDTVRAALDDDDDTTVRIVASVAALLVCVAYADLDYAPAEEDVLRRTLERIHGLNEQGVTTILRMLRDHTVTITGADATSYARELLELTAEDFRLELLDVMLDLAASDDEISVTETNMLRGVSVALGLTQQHYNASQARHREKLGVLSSRG